MKGFSWPVLIALLGVLAVFILSVLLLVWLLLPVVTGLVFSQPITIITVPFIDYNGQPLDIKVVVTGIAVVTAAFGALAVFLYKRLR